MAAETEARVREVLSYISPNCDRHTWAEVICPGIKNGAGEAAHGPWHEWSSQGDGYKFHEAEAVWRSWSEFGKRTFASVVALAKLEGYDPKKGGYTPPTAEQKAAMDAKATAATAARKIDDKAKADKARERGQKMWDEAKPATDDHPYLKKKGIPALNLRVGKWVKRAKDPGPDGKPVFLTIENVLLVPILDKARKFHGVQGITVEGEKLHLFGVAKQHHFSPIVGEGGMVLAEGWATAVSVHRETGFTVLCCFDIGNVMAVATDIHAAGKADGVIIAADNDAKAEAEGKVNQGMTTAIAAGMLFGMKVAVPPPGDFNDCSPEETVSAFAAAKVPDEAYMPLLAPVAKAKARPAADSSPPAGHLDDASDEMRDDDEPLEPEVVLDDRRPTIKVKKNNVKSINNQAEAALLAACPFLYSRAGDIVRPMIALVPDGRGGLIRTIKIRRLTRAALHEHLDSAAKWTHFDARSKKDVPIDAPPSTADALLARGESRLRPLSAVIEAPTLRADGSVLDVPGYDAATGLLYVPNCDYPSMPHAPTMEEAASALKRIEAVIDQFPYVSPADRAVALSAVLTTAVRRSLPKAPMFAMSATAAGSGKSYLVDYPCIIATGSPVPVFSQGGNEDEMEKRLHGALLAGHAIVSFDNVTRAIEGNALCQAMTQEMMEVRVLGTSETRTVPTSTTFFATGNGLVVREDMTRRVLECRLDPAMERPELRSFDFDPLEVAKANRARLLVDALIVIRAHHLAQPGARSKRFNFDKWSAMVADALVWLGYADPAESMDRTRANDPAKEEFNAVAREWRRHFGDKLVSVREAIDVATHQIGGGIGARFEFSNPDFREALLQIAGAGGAINSKKLGWWLKRKVGTIVDHLTVLAMGGAQKVQRWGFGSPVIEVKPGGGGKPAAAVDDGPPL